MTDLEIRFNQGPGPAITQQEAVRQLHNYHELLMAAHLRGKHPYGSMRRDCPLCQRLDQLGHE